MKNALMLLTLMGFALLSGACTTNRLAPATSFNGVSSPDGQPIGHLNTSKLAIHLLISDSATLVGDASLPGTVDEFTRRAKEEHASKVHIVQSDVTKWWWVFPPFSFVLTPVSSNVAGDILP